ncbi:YgaP-like transmembrane domain [Halovenus salina]|uniref:YgaP-like transmembrane domain n=1 Tax=Halovenus salina TaxID=1510225 RepID=A0ABD5W7E1_9EURY|nr:YgaP-like transmembrane domain [Halovenus salina]
MEQNVGGFDRTARLVAGPILAVVGLLIVAGVVSAALPLGAALLLVGVVLLGTGLTQRCIINQVLGVNTCNV